VSAALCARDAVADSMMWEHSAHGWRLIALEAIGALASAKRQEVGLREQLDSLRSELQNVRKVCSVAQPAVAAPATVDEWGDGAP
jgi:hypothetical protein